MHTVQWSSPVPQVVNQFTTKHIFQKRDFAGRGLKPDLRRVKFFLCVKMTKHKVCENDAPQCTVQKG